MKRNIVEIVIGSLLAATLAATAASAGTVTLGVPGGPVAAASTFNVPVRLTNVFAGTLPGDELLGFGFNVVVGNPVVLQFLGATVAPPFNDLTGVLPGTDVAGDVFPGLTSAAEPLLLATLRFRALAAGTSSVSITSNTSDPNQGLIFLGESLSLSGQASVTATAAVPEPGAVVPMAAALALLLVRRGRREADR